MRGARPRWKNPSVLLAALFVLGARAGWVNNTACLKLTPLGCDACFDAGCSFCFDNEYDNKTANFCFDGNQHGASYCKGGLTYIVDGSAKDDVNTCAHSFAANRAVASIFITSGVIILVAGYPALFWFFYSVFYKCGESFRPQTWLFCLSCVLGPCIPCTPLPAIAHKHDLDLRLAMFYIKRKKFGFPRDNGSICSSLWHFLRNHDRIISIFSADDENPSRGMQKLCGYITLVVYRLLFVFLTKKLAYDDPLTELFIRAVVATLLVQIIDISLQEMTTCSISRHFCPLWTPRFEDLALRGQVLLLTTGVFIVLIASALLLADGGHRNAYMLEKAFWNTFIISEVMSWAFPLVGTFANFFVVASWKKGYVVIPSIRGLCSSEWPTIFKYTGGIAFGIGEDTWLEDKEAFEEQLARPSGEIKITWMNRDDATTTQPPPKIELRPLPPRPPPPPPRRIPHSYYMQQSPFPHQHQHQPPMTMPMHVSGSQRMAIIVPPGAAPGTILTVQVPTGHMLQVAVPAGVTAGQQLEFFF